MTILQLVYYCTACECGSVTRAAQKLFVTQPTITAAIRQLEKEYHMELLDRKDKGVRLTPEGKEFYESGKNLLSNVNEFHKRMLQMGMQKKYVYLGLTRSVGAYTYVEYFPYGSQQHPQMYLSTCIGSSEELLKKLKEGILDVIIIPSQEDKSAMESLEVKKLWTTHMLYCMSEKHPLASKSVLKVSMIVNEPMISTIGDKNKTAALVRLFRDNGFEAEPNIVGRYEQLNMALSMVRNNLGTGYFPVEAVRNQKGIVFRRIETDPDISIYVVTTRESGRKEEVKKLIRSLVRFYQQKGKQAPCS